VVAERQVGVRSSPALAGFSVPKKKFKRSVDRHSARRLMVEAWRLNKHLLYEAIPPECQVHVFLVFTGSELAEWSIVEAACAGIIKKLAATFSNGNSNG